MNSKSLIIVIVAVLFLGFTAALVFKAFNDDRNEPSLNPPLPEPFTTTDDPETSHFDVIVVGGEPEGVAAAVSAARNGAKTLLVEERDGLGGLMTYGMLNFLDVANDKNGDNANAGIFKEWHNLVGNKIAFDIDQAKKAFLTLTTNEKNLTVALNTTLSDVSVDNQSLENITVNNEQGSHKVYAEKFIDSTQDGDLAEKAGAPYFVGREDIGIEKKSMAVTPMIHLKNVDWEKIHEAIESKKFGEASMNDNVAWGFGKLHHMYEPKEENTRLRGLNIARNSDGTIVINALQIFGVDGLDEESKKKALEKGKREIKHIVKYLKEEFPGFEDAEVASYPTELYVRETRHFVAEYQLSIADVWENKDQWDSIGFGSYPVDVQATSKDDWGYVIADPIQYAVPFRSLVPKKIDGLLIASKASGYSSLAAGSARVIPTGMTAGQAAGAASALAIDHEVSFREMSRNKELISTLQEKLKGQGANLYDFDLDYSYEGKWYYPKLKNLLSWGLISGGYENDFGVDKEMSKIGFMKLLRNASARVNEEKFEKIDQIYKQLLSDQKKSGEQITRDEAAKFLIDSLETEENYSGSKVWEHTYTVGLIDKLAKEKLKNDKPLNRAEAYYLLGLAIEQLEESK